MKYPKALEDKVFEFIGSHADKLGVRAFVVGGFVRDFFLGRASKDIDIVVVGSGIELARSIAFELRTNVSVFKTFGTAMLRMGDKEIEFVGARKESYSPDSRKPNVEDGTIEDDQLRRDFTINAMAFSINSDTFGELFDPFDGLGDLDRCLIKTPCDPDITFSDDPLRMIRAVRFASRFGFDIDEQTFEAIVRNKERMSIVSKERITDELNKIMASEVPSMGFMLFDACELLENIFPELAKLKGVETRGGRSHKDNFLHTLQVLDNVALKSDNLWLRWAALLHDIAKPQTKSYDPKLGWSFHSHETLGSKMIPSIFSRMRLPMNDKMKYVRKLVFLHLRPIILSEDVVTDSAVRRLLFEAGDDIDDLMSLCEADITSKNEVKVKRFLANFELVRVKLKEIEEKDRVRNFQPPISGQIIMDTYGIEPCREVGLIKEVIKDAILEGTIENDYDQAYAMMEKLAADYGFTKKAN
ncbi:MAG: HD domain-containing protein [Rikenellaceae bacterium]